MPPINPALIEAISGARQPTIAGSGQTRINPALTQAMMAQGLRPGPVTSKTQAFAKIGTAAIGGILERLGAEKIQAVRDKVAGALDGLGGISKSQKEFAQALISADKIPEALDMIKGIKDRRARREDERLGRSSRERIAKGKVAKFETVRVGGVTYQKNTRTNKIEALPDVRTGAEKNLEARGLKPGSPEFQAAMKAFMTQKKGDTNVSVNVDTNLTKKTQSVLEGKILDTHIAFGRLKDIGDSFKPKFQTSTYRAKMLTLQGKAKSGIFDLSQSERAELTEFMNFKLDSVDNMNRYIKEITGAQMSEGEAKRLIKGIPNPGTGLFDGDDPVSFAAKMNRLKMKLRTSLARLIWMRRHGIISPYEGVMKPDGSMHKNVLSLPAMRKKIDSRYRKLKAKFKKDGFEGDNLMRKLTNKINIEFYTPLPQKEAP